MKSNEADQTKESATPVATKPLAPQERMEADKKDRVERGVPYRIAEKLAQRQAEVDAESTAKKGKK